MSRVLVLVLLIAISAILVLSLARSLDSALEEDAKKLFLEDLSRKYPDAQVREIVQVTPLAGSNGSYYQLKARVSSDLASPCPTRLHIYYNYPPQNFVTQPPDVVTTGCQLCINAPTCVLAFEEEAIVASHTYEGTKQILDYISAYSNAVPSAYFTSEYSQFANVWVVEWDSPSATYSFKAVLSKTGKAPLAILSKSKQ